MDINGFKGSFQDLARANRFKVRLSRLGGTMEFLCKGTDMPGQNLEAMDVAYQGRTIKEVGDRTQTDWTVTVYGENAMSIYQACDAWMEEGNGQDSNVGAPASALREQGQVQLMGRDGSVLMTKNIVDCFPTELGSLSLDWGSNNTPLEFTITFAFNTAPLA